MVEVFDLAKEVQPKAGEHVKRVLKEAEDFKVLAVALAAGTSIPPCVMHNHTVFYFAGGSGRLEVDGEVRAIHDGNLAIVPPGAQRSVIADEPMTVVAVQVRPASSSSRPSVD